MSKKLRFKPEITRVKLDPEQAVLNCACYDLGNQSFYNALGSAPGPDIVACNTNMYPRTHADSLTGGCSTSTCGGGLTSHYGGGAASSS